MNELVFFEIPKQNLKIQIVKKSDEILEQIRKESAETAVMPDVAQYYTDIYFPPSCFLRTAKWPMGIIPPDRS